MPEQIPKRKVTTIEDIEYLGSSIFRGLGPMCFDFGDFGIEEKAFLFIPYLSEEDYKTFKEDVVERRGNYSRTDDRGFKFQIHYVDERAIPIIRGLAEKIQKSGVISPHDDTASALGLNDPLKEKIQELERSVIYSVINQNDNDVKKELVKAATNTLAGNFIELERILGLYVILEYPVE